MPNQTPDISIVVPCYNEEASLPLFLNELAQVVRSMRAAKPLEFEVVLVDDGSSDSTLAIMKEQANVCCNDYCIKWVSFSRNFGKEAALYAGLEHATGNLVATMDADMQDPPSLLPEMYRILQDEDCDNVATRRTTREGEPPIRSPTSTSTGLPAKPNGVSSHFCCTQSMGSSHSPPCRCPSPRSWARSFASSPFSP